MPVLIGDEQVLRESIGDHDDYQVQDDSVVAASGVACVASVLGSALRVLGNEKAASVPVGASIAQKSYVARKHASSHMPEASEGFRR